MNEIHIICEFEGNQTRWMQLKNKDRLSDKIKWFCDIKHRSCFRYIPEFAVKNPKCNLVPWRQVHRCILCQTLGVDECTVLGGVFQNQGLEVQFIGKTHQTNHPTSVCSIIHVSMRLRPRMEMYPTLRKSVEPLSVRTNGNCNFVYMLKRWRPKLKIRVESQISASQNAHNNQPLYHPITFVKITLNTTISDVLILLKGCIVF